MMQCCRRYAGLLLGLVFITTLHAQQQEIIFSTAPTHSPEVTQRIYSPLLKYLSQATGQRFVLASAANFVEYSSGMQANRYDMLFDGPHLSGWRIDQRDHEPLARLPGQIRFVIIGREDSMTQSMQELELGRAQVCAFASPNMLTLAFLSYFPHPARQPVLVRTQGFAQLEECLRSGRGDVAVVRDGQWRNMNQDGLRLIETQREAYPERTFTIGRHVDPALREQIRQALLSEEGLQAMADLLKTFNRDKLIPAKSSDYEGLGLLLLPVWGFH